MSQLSVEPSASSSPHTVRRPGEVADEVLEPGQQRSKAYRNHRHCFHQFDPVLFISLSVAIINLQLNHLSLSAIVNPQVKLQSITTRWLQGIHWDRPPLQRSRLHHGLRLTPECGARQRTQFLCQLPTRLCPFCGLQPISVPRQRGGLPRCRLRVESDDHQWWNQKWIYVILWIVSGISGLVGLDIRVNKKAICWTQKWVRIKMMGQLCRSFLSLFTWGWLRWCLIVNGCTNWPAQEENNCIYMYILRLPALVIPERP